MTDNNMLCVACTGTSARRRTVQYTVQRQQAWNQSTDSDQHARFSDALAYVWVRYCVCGIYVLPYVELGYGTVTSNGNYVQHHEEFNSRIHLLVGVSLMRLRNNDDGTLRYQQGCGVGIIADRSLSKGLRYETRNKQWFTRDCINISST